MQPDHEQANRWDYLLGHAPSGNVVAVEPHSAKQDEITTLINKRVAAREQMRGHLRDGARVAKWLWVASGKVHFANTEKTRPVSYTHLDVYKRQVLASRGVLRVASNNPIVMT